MISIEQITLVGVLGIVALVIFLSLIIYLCYKEKKGENGKPPISQEISNIDIEVWQQEREFWISRLILILMSNSILFLSYVQVRLLQFGGIIAILAFVGNILYSIYFAAFARKHDSLQKRIAVRIPIEYRQRTLTGRWGFVPLIVILQLIWIVSLLHSFFGWFT